MHCKSCYQCGKQNRYYKLRVGFYSKSYVWKFEMEKKRMIYIIFKGLDIKLA